MCFYFQFIHSRRSWHATGSFRWRFNGTPSDKRRSIECSLQKYTVSFEYWLASVGLTFTVKCLVIYMPFSTSFHFRDIIVIAFFLLHFSCGFHSIDYYIFVRFSGFRPGRKSFSMLIKKKKMFTAGRCSTTTMIIMTNFLTTFSIQKLICYLEDLSLFFMFKMWMFCASVRMLSEHD